MEMPLLRTFTGPSNIFGAPVPMGISHLLFDSRWVTKLHSISHQTSQPFPKKQPQKWFCFFAYPSACDAEAAALSRVCAFCYLSSLQLWIYEEILFDRSGRSGKIWLWKLVLGTYRAPGLAEKTSVLPLIF